MRSSSIPAARSQYLLDPLAQVPDPRMKRGRRHPLAGLGADRGPAEESTFRRAFATISADVLDQVLGACLHARAAQVSGRLVIAVDGKAVRGRRTETGRPRTWSRRRRGSSPMPHPRHSYLSRWMRRQ
jgi:hypothetical protein